MIDELCSNEEGVFVGEKIEAPLDEVKVGDAVGFGNRTCRENKVELPRMLKL